MEPDIIRMYSSSPPPLDHGTEDDDEEEFGEFGGFSEVSPSGVGFVDFDTPDYTRPKEDFVPSNHFMPIHEYSENVDSLTSFKSVQNGNDKDITADLSTPVKSQSDVVLSSTSKEMIPSKALDTSNHGTESLGDLGKVVVQGPSAAQLTNFSPGNFRTDKNTVHQTKQLESCNGEKPPCLEILTNGFAGLETVNPQGTDDLDNVADSKGSKPLNTCGTECILESTASLAMEFADFSTFSQSERTQLEEIECAVLNDGDALTIQGNSKSHRVKELNCMKEVTLGGSFEDTGNTETEHQVCVSEIHAIADRGLSVEKQDLQTLQQDEFLNSRIQSEAWSLVDSSENSEAITRERCKTEENNLLASKCADLSMDSIKTSDFNEIDSSKEENRKLTNPKSPHPDPTDENVLDDSAASMKNGDSGNSFVTCHDTNEDDFGDFGTASGTTPPFATSTQDSMSDVTFEDSSEHFLHFSEPGDDFGEFEDTNAVSCQEEMIFTESDLRQTSDGLSEECPLAGESGGKGSEPDSKLKNGQDCEFGDFDSVPNTQGSAFQDSDDFADFSSAGPSQAVDWNAFEDEQKDGCSWAAFGDQQASKSHHRKEAWQSHRTDGTMGTLETHKMHSVSSEASKGTVASGRLQEPATSVQEVTSLKHGLRDVWTELQDIHDAHGLRYQWGGSHSNKKLFVLLGNRHSKHSGMLEPTKEPLKPLSAAEKIASIGQRTIMTPEINTCTSDPFQESLPPVQFDWSSSGLTNPLDAECVDPELYELTTAKLETSTSSLRVTDAFAKLMSTVEKTSTSTRKPKREEHLSEEAAKVIASLPDLTFMHAKVLMFPATLTPSTRSQERADA
ncbi:Aftiphilin [Apodemus speciosus]|uniref:Aftiphilin n=1 Tax=Apodemus speciosus TaxID=105296 RepID=A0ABQ0F9A4_APOSI